MKNLFGECISEFIGTFILMFFGTGCVSTLILLGNISGMWQVSILWGIAIALAIWVTGGVSGTHINPAVTLSFAIHRGFPWRKVVPYIVSQLVGAFAGAGISHVLFSAQFKAYEIAHNVVFPLPMQATVNNELLARIVCTYPLPGISNVLALFIEFSLTTFLLITIYAVIDDRNPAAPQGNMGALVIGLVVAMIGGTFGSLTGFAMNPARDFGPRFFIYLLGYGKMALPGPDGYFWVPIVGPILGGIFAGYVYDNLVRRFLPTMKKPSIPADMPELSESLLP